jgi:hypothetical protein
MVSREGPVVRGQRSEVTQASDTSSKRQRVDRPVPTAFHHARATHRKIMPAPTFIRRGQVVQGRR